MVWIKAFVAGFLATLIFHQGLFAVFYLAGAAPAAPFNLTPVPPLGVPSVISLAFFGGLWGVAIWAIAGRLKGALYWLPAPRSRSDAGCLSDEGFGSISSDLGRWSHS
jgi:hypothetical protein